MNKDYVYDEYHAEMKKIRNEMQEIRGNFSNFAGKSEREKYERVNEIEKRLQEIQAKKPDASANTLFQVGALTATAGISAMVMSCFL